MRSKRRSRSSVVIAITKPRMTVIVNHHQRRVGLQFRPPSGGRRCLRAGGRGRQGLGYDATPRACLVVVKASMTISHLTTACL